MANRKFAAVVCFVFAVLVALMGYFAQGFKVDASADTLLTQDNKHFIRTQVANQRYSPQEFILIAYRPDNASIYSSEVLERIKEIGAKIADVERVEVVRSLVNVPIFVGMSSFSSNLDPSSLSWDAKRYDQSFMQKSLAKHPLYEGLLVNDTHDALSMQVVFRPKPELEKINDKIIDIQATLLTGELDDEQKDRLAKLKAQKEGLNKALDKKRIEEIEAIRSILAEYESTGKFFLGGANLLAYQLIDIIKNDLLVFGGTIFLITCLILYALFRNFRWVFLPLLSCAVSVVITIGLLSLLGLKVTVISANVIALQIILTLAVVLHLVVQYEELLDGSSGSEHKELVWQMLKRKASPCFYASFTTSIGFGSLIFSGVQPVISFGWMMVVAMAVTLLVSLVFFPALLVALFSSPAPAQNHEKLNLKLQQTADWVLANGKKLSVVCLLFCVVGIVGIFRLSAENSFLDYFKDSTDVHRELSFIDSNFGGSTALDILYDIPVEQRDKNLVITASAIQSLEAIQQKLAHKEAVGNITSIADFTRVAQVVNGKPLTEYEITALYRALDENLRRDLFGAYFSEDAQQIRLSARIKDSTENLDRSALLAEIHQDIKDLGISEDQYRLTNLFILYEDILNRLVDSQVLTLAIVYFAMALVLSFLFRSLRIAAVALVPNLITTICILGAMGLAGVPLDLMTITIASVAMGISVDDTIHYIHRYREELGNEDPVRATNLSVGRAMVYTSAVIVIGFAALIFSDFMPSVYFGLLTALAMVLALVTDLTILPVMLQRWVRAEAN